jgi:hypothetical protein
MVEEGSHEVGLWPMGSILGLLNLIENLESERI